MPTLTLLPAAPLSIDAVVLDLDGTLVDTLDDFTAAIGAMQADLGLPRSSRHEVARAVGKGSAHLINALLPPVDIQNLAIKNAAISGQPQPHPLYQQAWASYQRHYARCNGQQARVHPGVVEGLSHLRGLGLPLACLTNKPLRFARELLARMGLAHAFAHIFGGDSFERTKPDPLPLLRTCQALGSAPHRTLMVGDSANDAEAAHAAGCPVVLLTHGYNHGQDVRQVPAQAHLDSLSELRGLLT